MICLLRLTATAFLTSVIGAAFTTGALAATIYPLGEASTATFGTGGTTGQTPRGWDFQVNAANVDVVQLGFNASNSDIPITVTLWNVGSQTELAQLVVPAGSGWQFAELATPVALASGSIYAVVGWADTTGGTPWYFFDNAPPAAFNPTGTITYLNGRFGAGIGADTFPTGILPSPDQYGVVDIGYQLSEAPEPASIGLLGFGITALCLYRRRHTTGPSQRGSAAAAGTTNTHCT